MKVKTLINRLLNYDMEHDVELIILGEDEGRLAERYTCTLPDDSIDGHGGGDYCPIIIESNELKDDDDDESIQDLILYKQGYARLFNFRKNKLKKKESNDKRG
jgi:hypothetical protein